MNKKGYMKTIEAILALVLVLGVVLTIANRNSVDFQTTPTEIELTQKAVNNIVQNDPELREAVLYNQTDRLNSTISQYFVSQKNLEYTFLICDTSYCPSSSNLPNKNIYTSNLIISSIYNETKHSVFKLYIWRKVE